MITNREEVIDKAFKVFLRMNYEKASISTLAKACGVVKTGVVYYFPHKLDLFMAVADKYVIQMQTPANKFAGPTETLAEFIEQYVAGVSAVMNHITKLKTAILPPMSSNRYNAVQMIMNAVPTSIISISFPK